MSDFSEKNYRDVNPMSDAAEKDWSLTGCFKNSVKQATVELLNGKEYQYACRWPFAEGDIAIVGNTLMQNNSPIEQSSNSGHLGVITYVEPKLTINRKHAVELDFVFTEKVSKKVIKDCIKYLQSPTDFSTVQYGTMTENYFPLSFYIRRLLSAASIIAHPKYAEPDDITAAKEYIGQKQDLEDLEILVGPPEAPGYNFTDTQIYTKDKSLKYLKKLGVEPEYDIMDLSWDISEEEADKIMENASIYLNKYSYIGAISIMVRGGFVNLLNAFLSTKPPIDEFVGEIIEYLGDTGNDEALNILKKYLHD